MKQTFKIIKKQTVNSTNEFAKELIQKGVTSEFTVIFANEQVSGKGQRQNNWLSDAGKNLTFSIISYPVFLKADEQFFLSKAISVGIIEYLNAKNKNFKIKWPNDIYYKDKKICGILIENSISGLTIKNSIIGIGLNINQKTFPNDLPNAVSLSNVCNKIFNLEDELKILLSKIYTGYLKLKGKNFEEINNLYHKNLYKLNELSNFKDINGDFTGKITGTLPSGKLVIETSENKIRTYNFKEVEFLPFSRF